MYPLQYDAEQAYDIPNYRPAVHSVLLPCAAAQGQ
jgi:hypothetical protein